MRRTYGVPGARITFAGLTAVLIVLASPGTSIAGGVSDSTQRAAVAAGPSLAQGAGFGSPRAADRVRALQRALRELGWHPGRVDGLFGPRTESAVVRFQSASGLTADGVVGRRTRETVNDALKHPLRLGAGYASPRGSQRVRSLQRELRRRGYRPGPVDGRYGPRTRAAVARLQRAAGLRATGVVAGETRRVLAGNDPTSRETRGVDAAATPSVDAAPTAQPRPEAEAPRRAAGDGRPEAGTASMNPAIGAILAAVLAVAGLAVLRFRRRVLGARRAYSGGPPSPYGLVSRWEPPAEARVVGYVSIPHADKDPEAYVGAHIRWIADLCEEGRWDLVEVVAEIDAPNGNGRPRRPGLSYALDRVARGDASCVLESLGGGRLGFWRGGVEAAGEQRTASSRHGREMRAPIHAEARELLIRGVGAKEPDIR